MSIHILMASYGRSGDPREFLAMGRRLEETGEPRAAASAYDRAFGLDPGDQEIADARRSLLDRLAVVEHGIVFRYIPAGIFLMGSDSGDPDEAPVHPVRLGDYWLGEVPVSWAAYCHLMGWSPPPEGLPPDVAEEPSKERRRGLFTLGNANKIRLQYCEDRTTRARDWHSHGPERGTRPGEWLTPSHSRFRPPQRDDPDQPWTYDQKPMVCVSWQEAEELGTRLTTGDVSYRLPMEAEWEKAARGGLIDARYPWGDEPPDASRCDFDRFDDFSILPSRRFPPNGYGLYAMCGGVWEWTSAWYDAEAYRDNEDDHPRVPADDDARVLRGGSWADCAEAVTVSFRMARKSRSWRDGMLSGHFAPNIGFRLCRVESPGPLRSG